MTEAPQGAHLVLIADADHAGRRLLTLQVEGEGHRVAQAADGPQALAVAERDPPDLILLDETLASQDEYSVLEALRQNPDTAAIPLILINAGDDRDAHRRGLDAGATDLLTKPFDPPLLRAKVRTLLRLRTATRGLQQQNARLNDLVEQRTRELRAVVEHAPGIILRVDGEGTIQFINRTVSGVAIEDALGSNWLDWIEPEDRERMSTTLASVLETGQPITTRLAGQGAEGRRAVYESHIGPLREGGQVTGAVIFTTDTTEKEILREAQHESEARFRRLVEGTLAIPWEADLREGFTYVGPQAREVLGYDPSRWLEPDFWEECILPEDREQVALQVQSTMGHSAIEYRVRAADGRVVWLRDTMSLRRRQGRRIVQGFMIDITSHKEAEAAVRASESRLRALTDSALDAIVVADAQGRIVSWNDGAQRMFGHAAEQVVGEPVSHIIPERHRADHERGLTRVARGGASRLLGRSVALAGLRQDGTEFPLEISLGSYEEQGAVFFTAILRDLSDWVRTQRALRESEEQLLQAQKLESLGRLAGGIAHDFNNALTAVQGYSELLEQRLEDEKPRRWAKNIQKAAEHSAALVGQLLAFCRKQALEPKAIDLNQVLGEVEELLGPLLGEDIELSLRLGENLGTVRADPGQIQQVVMNLAVNARDAMPSGGQLRVVTRNAEVSERQGQAFSGVPAGSYVLVLVTDTGSGMDAETQKKVFEPFFTTKGVGKGTGLGLSTVYGIVRQSGGWINLYSEVGQGTTFRIYLPRIDEASDARETREDAPSPGGAETILIVDDEVLVSEYAAEILRHQGYDVSVLNDPSQARPFAAAHALDLVISDVVMPKLSGPQVLSQVHEVAPQTKVLFMSGHTGDLTIRSELNPEQPFLPKPFSAVDLLQKVRQVLDG